MRAVYKDLNISVCSLPIPWLSYSSQRPMLLTKNKPRRTDRKQAVPFSLLRWTGTSLLMLLLSSSVDSLRTKVGSFWASQSATLLSDAIIAACSVLRSLPPAPPLPAPLFLERDLWWSGVNFDTWSLMVTFPGEVLSNSMVKEA